MRAYTTTQNPRPRRKARHVVLAFALCALAIPVSANAQPVASPDTGYSSVNAVVKAELFTTEVRTVGVAVPYNLAQALFGGTASYVALAFADGGHENWFFLYVSGCALISLITYALMPETSKTSLVEPEPEQAPRVGVTTTGTAGTCRPE